MSAIPWAAITLLSIPRQRYLRSTARRTIPERGGLRCDAFEDPKHLFSFEPPPGSKTLEQSGQQIVDQLHLAGARVGEDYFVAATPLGQSR